MLKASRFATILPEHPFFSFLYVQTFTKPVLSISLVFCDILLTIGIRRGNSLMSSNDWWLAEQLKVNVLSLFDRKTFPLDRFQHLTDFSNWWFRFRWWSCEPSFIPNLSFLLDLETESFSLFPIYLNGHPRNPIYHLLILLFLVRAFPCLLCPTEKYGV